MFQRYARGGSHSGLARAGAALQPFRAWIDDWHLQSIQPASVASAPPHDSLAVDDASDGWLPLEVSAREDNLAMQPRLTSDRPLVRQGDAGFSRKHPNGGGSHYYSHPFLEAEGFLAIDGKEIQVTGQAWLDREWSSQFLQADQSGWDWFALHLDSGEKLMLFRLRDSQSDSANYRHGVLISPNGSKRTLDPSAIRFEVVERTKVQGRRIPTKWRIVLEDIDRALVVNALHPRQWKWMDVDFPYWEGYVTASGSSPGESGRGLS